MPEKKQLTSDKVRQQLMKLAKKQGLDPALVESALDPQKDIPDELLELLTLVAEHTARTTDSPANASREK